MAKAGGSRKGSPNKSTARVRNAIAVFADSHIDDFFKWLEDIAVDDKKAAADLFLKTIEYHIPKLQRIDADVNVTSDLDWLKKLEQPNE